MLSTWLSQVHLLDAQDLHSLPVCVQARTSGVEYFVDHYKGHLLLLTNKSGDSTACAPHAAAEVDGCNPAAAGQDYCLMTVPASLVFQQQHSGTHSWQLLVPERPDVAVTDLSVFDTGVVLHELAAGRPALTLLRLSAEQQGTEQPGGLTVLHQQRVSSAAKLHRRYLSQALVVPGLLQHNVPAACPRAAS